jgi:hypothetical protein
MNGKAHINRQDPQSDGLPVRRRRTRFHVNADRLHWVASNENKFSCMTHVEFRAAAMAMSMGSSTTGTITQAIEPPGFPSDGDSKTGISSLELSRHLGVNYDTAWLPPQGRCHRGKAAKQPAEAPLAQHPAG